MANKWSIGANNTVATRAAWHGGTSHVRRLSASMKIVIMEKTVEDAHIINHIPTSATRPVKSGIYRDGFF